MKNIFEKGLSTFSDLGIGEPYHTNNKLRNKNEQQNNNNTYITIKKQTLI